MQNQLVLLCYDVYTKHIWSFIVTCSFVRPSHLKHAQVCAISTPHMFLKVCYFTDHETLTEASIMFATVSRAHFCPLNMLIYSVTSSGRYRYNSTVL